ncbi:Apoptosis-resistant E3 ubiquitin protein ligase 1 [Tyrophagus putrescentiae]|nr:Apoptosis-resistant E3 ubiquitin protein ligase 1 [Tyrophagus putrescentiae]
MESLKRWISDNIGTLLLTALVPIGVIELFKMISNFPSIFAIKEGKCGFLTFITGSYLAPQNCKVIFDWKSPTTVSNVSTFSIKFFQRNYQPYPITPEDQLSVHIQNGSQVVPCSVEFGDLNPSLANVARVSFSTKKAGNYTIHIVIGSTLTHIRGSPFTDIQFQPLSPSPFETAFVNHCSTVVCTVQNFHALIVEMRDRFGNLCLLDDAENEKFDASEDFTVTITEVVNDKKVDALYYWQKEPSEKSRVTLLLLLQSSGIYHALVSYKGSLLKNGEFSIVCLTALETEAVRKCTISTSKSCNFSAKLLPSTGYPYSGTSSPSLTKSKNVICYISPKQLTIKEFILRIIPKRITSFRLSPSTKFYFVRNYNHVLKGSSSCSSADIFSSASSDFDIASLSSGGGASFSSDHCPNADQFLIIDDGSQTPVELMTPERNIIVAVFTYFLLSKIGGSETFHDKQDFFNSEVRRYHAKSIHTPGRVHLKIDRSDLLESSIKATRSFSISDWCKRFEIEFDGEIALDFGGVRREWYELLCRALFEPQNSRNDVALFMRFQNDKQGLIHPNPNSNARLFYYEFAGRIVGKSLLDTALGSSSKCYVKARFTRSFLAQLIGLRVNYRYFDKDDPELYVQKIKFILENDVSLLDLFFVEEEYESGKLVRTIDLIQQGSRTRVTEENKSRYLDALAQYRLSTCVKEQVEAFLKGLNDLIPDNLLSIFDENELELLICGAATYSVSDLRLNHIVTGSTYDFQRVVDWFWRSVNAFSDEEFARLLQFTTGCSHLPPGGFADLNPRFQISSSLTYATLPTAHTCFNQICLPDCDSFDAFDRSLRIAITEGSEGFGLI